MANLYSDGNRAVAEILSQELGLALADRGYIGMHPVLAGGYLGAVQGTGAQTISKEVWDLGAGTASPLSEDGQASVVDYTFTKYQVTVARKSTGRKASDMLRMIDAGGQILDPQALAFDAATIRGSTMMDLIADTAATFTTDVLPSGGSGNDLTWDTIRRAKYSLIANNVQGPLLCVLHPQQWHDLEAEFGGTSLGDALTHTDEARSIQIARAAGFQGSMFGIDFYTSNRVPTANSGADYRGALFAPLGIVHGEGLIPADPHSLGFLLDGGRIQIAFDRDESRMTKAAYFNTFLGVAKGDDSRGVTITSDA